MILEIFKGSFEYLFQNKKSLLTITKIGFLMVFSFLIFPFFLVYGFSYRIILIGLTGNMSYTNDPLPDFSNMKEMLFEGIKTFLVKFTYFLPTIIFTIMIIFNEIVNIDFNNLSSFTIDFKFSPLFLIILLSCFISFIFSSVAIPHMINKENIKYAFNFKELIKIVRYTSIMNYIKTFIILMILFIFLTIISFIISQFLVNLIGFIHLSIYSIDFIPSIFGYLSVFVFLICFLFSLGLFTMIESRIISFLYNEDGLEE